MNSEKKKTYTSAPLPFMGQKRRFLKDFKNAVATYPSDATYVDLFGGSGFLSYLTKQVHPNATVIYNDFDNYRERISNIDKTNQLIADLREILKGSPTDKRIVGDFRVKVLDRVKLEDKKGYVDYITLSSSILFSMKYVQSFAALQKETLYNTCRQSDYTAVGYLDGLNVVELDYKALFNEYKDVPNVVFLVDPPYLSTDVSTYKSYWKLKDYLDVLQVLNGTNYFYFTSQKSSIIELCEWIETKTPLSNPFIGANRMETTNPVNYSSKFTDIMLYKWVSNDTTL
jgi:hypothetical protein